MIEFEHISFSYEQNPVLENLNCTFARGRNTILIGPSGCGKSTILRLVNGLLAAQQGRILIDGHQVTADNVLSMRRNMGYLIQQGGLFPHMTARENITLMARRLKWSLFQTTKRLEELQDLTRIESALLDRYPAALSGGQQQRISLIRALMLDPEILLFDEPLAALDPLIRDELQQSMKGIFKKLQKTVVWVTHDLNEAAFLGDSIILLQQGRVVQTGTAAELLKKPANDFVRRFISAQRGHLPGAG